MLDLASAIEDMPRLQKKGLRILRIVFIFILKLNSEGVATISESAVVCSFYISAA
jgi:hypothetical protein